MQAPHELAILEQTSELFFGDQPQVATPGEGIQISDLQLVCRGQHSHDVPLLVLEDDQFRYATIARDMSGFRRVQAVPGVAMSDNLVGIPWPARYLSMVAAMAMSVLPSFLPPP